MSRASGKFFITPTSLKRVFLNCPYYHNRCAYGMTTISLLGMYFLSSFIVTNKVFFYNYIDNVDDEDNVPRH
jgi:hypothetical protein